MTDHYHVYGIANAGVSWCMYSIHIWPGRPWWVTAQPDDLPLVSPRWAEPPTVTGPETDPRLLQGPGPMGSGRPRLGGLPHWHYGRTHPKTREEGERRWREYQIILCPKSTICCCCCSSSGAYLIHSVWKPSAHHKNPKDSNHSGIRQKEREERERMEEKTVEKERGKGERVKWGWGGENEREIERVRGVWREWERRLFILNNNMTSFS